MSTETLEAQLQRLAETAARKAEQTREFLATQPQSVSCRVHPHVNRQIDLEASMRATANALGTLTAGYLPCSLCADAARLKAEADRLHSQGVPEKMLHARLDNWHTNDAQQEAVLRSVREFVAKRVGFLVLLGGDVGTGKSHLAVAIMREFRSAVFVKQSTLLRQLRATYRNATATDPIEQCQSTGLLVIDEMGLSGGGRDELPMLHEILDYRYGERKPTVLTGNVAWDDFRAIIGERLTDRLREAAFKVLTLAGQSHRPERRRDYFGDCD